MTTPQVFGLTISPLTAEGVAAHVVGSPRHTGQGVGLVVTPNIQHVAELRRDEAFRHAYAGADIITCDGFPVHYYARSRGCPSPERVTGCDIATALMADPALLRDRPMFFVVDNQATADAVHSWGERHGLKVATHVPPLGFEKDADGCAALARQIAAYGTSILFMCVGAPRSEIFVDRYRDLLPPCWALCVGQAVKIVLGLAPKPPVWVKRLNLEWLWRILLEPRRLLRRYVFSVFGFLLAVAMDRRAADAKARKAVPVRSGARRIF